MSRIDNCFGFCISKKFGYVELWICFSPVEPHIHPLQTVKIIPLWGWAMFYKGCKHIQICPKKWLKSFIIKPSDIHWFTLIYAPLIFLSISSKSPADNFVTEI